LFTPSNFTSAACLFATSEGRLYRLYIGFFRTDIPSSQYNGDRLTSVAGLVATLGGPGPFTHFVPIDAAIDVHGSLA
jgi:hypothetical protein